VSDTATLLATLADVREPPTPDTGLPWLILLNVALAIAWLVLLLWQRHRRRNAWRREALATVHALRDDDSPDGPAALATLLRQVARHRLGDGVARLGGDDWLAALDRCFRTNWFSTGEGRAFGDALYRRGDRGPDLRRLCDGVESELRRLPAVAARASAEASADGPADAPADGPADEPADGAAGGPADAPADGPADGPAGEPAAWAPPGSRS